MSLTSCPLMFTWVTVGRYNSHLSLRGFLALQQYFNIQAPTVLLYCPDTIYFGDNRLSAIQIAESSLVYVGFAYQKNWDFAELFNYHFRKMDGTGVLDKIIQKCLSFLSSQLKGLLMSGFETTVLQLIQNELHYNTLDGPFHFTKIHQNQLALAGNHTRVLSTKVDEQPLNNPCPDPRDAHFIFCSYKVVQFCTT